MPRPFSRASRGIALGTPAFPSAASMVKSGHEKVSCGRRSMSVLGIRVDERSRLQAHAGRRTSAEFPSETETHRPANVGPPDSPSTESLGRTGRQVQRHRRRSLRWPFLALALGHLTRRLVGWRSPKHGSLHRADIRSQDHVKFFVQCHGSVQMAGAVQEGTPDGGTCDDASDALAPNLSAAFNGGAAPVTPAPAVGQGTTLRDPPVPNVT